MSKYTSRIVLEVIDETTGKPVQPGNRLIDETTGLTSSEAAEHHYEAKRLLGSVLANISPEQQEGFADAVS